MKGHIKRIRRALEWGISAAEDEEDLYGLFLHRVALVALDELAASAPLSPDEAAKIAECFDGAA